MNKLFIFTHESSNIFLNNCIIFYNLYIYIYIDVLIYLLLLLLIFYVRFRTNLDYSSQHDTILLNTFMEKVIVYREKTCILTLFLYLLHSFYNLIYYYKYIATISVLLTSNSSFRSMPCRMYKWNRYGLSQNILLPTIFSMHYQGNKIFICRRKHTYSFDSNFNLLWNKIILYTSPQRSTHNYQSIQELELF